jgi:hypothetical protein
MKNDTKKKRETWRLAIRLLEKHLTRANRAQNYDKKLAIENGSNMRGALRSVGKAAQVQNHREIRRKKGRLDPRRRRSRKNMDRQGRIESALLSNFPVTSFSGSLKRKRRQGKPALPHPAQ